MEGREGINSGVTVIGAEAPSAYHVAPRSEAPNSVHNPEAAVVAAGAATVGVSPVSVGLDGTTAVKKKRGRPRKYGPDGSVNMALSPLPISSSAPPSHDFASVKRGRPHGMEYKKAKKVVMDHLGNCLSLIHLVFLLISIIVYQLSKLITYIASLGEMNGYSDGTHFMPHFITVNAGEVCLQCRLSFM